jgi:glycolate oxidase FAD binding subunit
MVSIPRTLAAIRALEGTVPIRAPAGLGRWMARPSTLDEVATVLRFAAERGRGVRPQGAGTKADWFTDASEVDVTLSTGGLDTWHYEPGSPVVTVGAGLPVQVAQVRLSVYGLRLPLDPRSAGATIGGVLATDEAGPMEMRFGRPVDQLIGAWGVRRGGTIVGLGVPDPTCGPVDPASVEPHPDAADLRWLATGVLVDAVLPVQAVPPASRYVSRDVGSPLEISHLLSAVQSTGVSPSAIELDLPAPDGDRIGRGGSLTVLIEGSMVSATDRAGTLADAFGPGARFSDSSPDGWGRYPWHNGDIAVRLDAPGDAIAAVAYAMRETANAPLAVRGSLGSGIGFAAIPAKTPAESVRAIVQTARDVLMSRGGDAAILAGPTPHRVISQRRPESL